MLSIITFKIF